MDTMKDTTMQPATDAVIEELRMLAEDLYVNGYNRYSSAMSQAADELESLQRYRTAYNEWIDKTEWLQKSLPAKYLGMHRADALKDMISELEERCATLTAALRLAVRQNIHDMLMTAEELRSCEAILEEIGRAHV